MRVIDPSRKRHKHKIPPPPFRCTLALPERSPGDDPLTTSAKKHEPKTHAGAQALQSSPHDAGLLTARALAHLKLGSWLEATDDATRAISLDPTSSKAFYRKG